MSGNGKAQEVFFDTSGLQELFFEDIRDLSVHNGILRFTLYSFRIVPGLKGEPVWVPIQPLAAPIGTFIEMKQKTADLLAKGKLIVPENFGKNPSLVH